MLFRSSFDLLRPARIKRWISTSFKAMGQAGLTFIKNFWWILLIDAGLFMGFGGYAAEHLLAKESLPLAFFLVLFAQSLLWSLTRGFYFLLMRKEEPLDLRVYLATYLFKLAQVMFAFFFVLLILLQIILAFKITKLPELSWHFTAIIHLLQLIIVFFWLDGPYSLLSVFKALERGVNLFFYNLPLMLVLLGILSLLDLGFGYAVATLTSTPQAHCLLQQNIAANPAQALTVVGRCCLLGIKYVGGLLECIWVAFVLGYYRRKRNDLYTENIFSTE